MTIGQILTNSPLPHRETEILLAFSLKKPREYLLAHPESLISAARQARFKLLVKRREKGWPIAYLVGEKGFYGLDILVTTDVLIPRPETELIVDEILSQKIPIGATIIDIGTGSGAIIIALAKNLKGNNLQLFATDISTRALAIAKKNARRHGLSSQIRFWLGDLLRPLKGRLSGQDLIIAANLPYLTKRQIAASPSIKKEPRLALDGGPDGLDCYRKLFKQSKDSDYHSLFLIGEIDPSQRAVISRLARYAFPAASLTIKKDLAGKNRFFILKA